jgi:hypothetical protein
VTDAGAQAVTINLTDEFGFAVHDVDGAFGTGGSALTAPVAFVFVDFDNIS